jgi:hypothetical protein
MEKNDVLKVQMGLGKGNRIEIVTMLIFLIMLKIYNTNCRNKIFYNRLLIFTTKLILSFKSVYFIPFYLKEKQL